MNFESSDLVGLSKGERLLIDSLISQGKQIVRSEDLRVLLGPVSSNPNLILSRLAQKGWLQRLKGGIYRIMPLGAGMSAMPEDSWLIATELFTPCYIGGSTAPQYWDLT